LTAFPKSESENAQKYQGSKFSGFRMVYWNGKGAYIAFLEVPYIISREGDQQAGRFWKGKNIMKRRVRALIVGIVIVALSLSACGIRLPGGNTGQSSDLAADIKGKYAANEDYIYLPSIAPVARDHKFELEMGFNPMDLGYEVFSEIIGVYADANFTIEAQSNWDVEQHDHDNSTIWVGPARSPALWIGNEIHERSVQEDYLSEEKKQETVVKYKGEFSDWGNLPRYFMVQWVDLQTGEKLEKPIVQVFEVKQELAAPRSSFYVSEKGRASFKWEPVKGAESYIVVETVIEEGAATDITMATVIGKVDGDQTSWEAESNIPFITAKNVAEEGIDPAQASGAETIDTAPDSMKCYGVVAIGADGNSAVGKLFKDKDLASQLPVSIAHGTRKAEGDNSNTVNTIGLLPAQIPIIMCDGAMVYKTIAYDYEGAKVVNETWLEYDEDIYGNPTNYRQLEVTILKIHWSLPNTDIIGYYNVLDPPSNWQDELQKLKERQENLDRASGTGNDVTFEDGRNKDAENDGNDSSDDGSDDSGDSGDSNKPVQDPAPSAPVEDIDIFASNALSEYLAINMLAGAQSIALDEFPEASDTEYLIDAFFEAYYQNPLILGVDGLALDRAGDLIVEYQENSQSREIKQSAIKEKVSKIIKETIKDSMSPLEKEMAINQYLCDNGEYDMAALKDAQANNFEFVDPSFNDSFNAYGILVDGVGVCSSYAAAFKLLADAAGLEAIVTTGTLEGSVAHAWNRILLDGEWVSVDVTNNDTPDLVNALLNLPDKAAATALVEDEEYMLDKYLSNYTAASDKNEYYHVESKFFDSQEIINQLTSGLKSGKAVTLRTDYFISDEEFSAIAQEVMEQLGTNELYGFYWLGVITLSTEG
jgi:transglutaminase-like putative cysteine protease